MKREEFIKNWGIKFWQYQIELGYTRESNQDEFERDLDELLKERAREAFDEGYCAADNGDNHPEKTFNEWYDTFIKEQ